MTDLNNTHENIWTFYIIYNNSATYAGISNDYIQRLRKHNGEISGGAKYTTGKGPGWKHLCIVYGFQTKNQALMFEWAVKHVPPRNAGGIINRIKKLYTVLNKKNWTNKSPDASTVPLSLQWKIAVDFTDVERFVPSYVTDISFCNTSNIQN
jgi:putative endonuclease